MEKAFQGEFIADVDCRGWSRVAGDELLNVYFRCSIKDRSPAALKANCPLVFPGFL